MPIYDLVPNVSGGAFVAPNATIIGEVTIDEYSSVWHNVVIRGDLNGVFIGKGVHIQDNTVISNTSSLPTGISSITTIGNSTVVQPNCSITSSRISANCFIGSNSVIGEGCRIEEKVFIESGSVVPAGSLLESGTIYGGNPLQEVGKVDYDLTFKLIRMNEACVERLEVYKQE